MVAGECFSCGGVHDGSVGAYDVGGGHGTNGACDGSYDHHRPRNQSYWTMKRIGWYWRKKGYETDVYCVWMEG